MLTRTSRVNVLVDTHMKTVFERLCKSNDVTPSQVLRRFMREYIERNEVHLEEAPASNGEKK